ncbi:DNA translocase FtsK [Conexibacter sp. DBS9H8]|uniref:DNA translocase FtsK n=1 Tax=Conexibacter sp. DBS9H8 TaxID=2937801 RepID=UPI00200D3EF0|nr:DNA translocase FtsK [Conexibacter sp. DBS9H8]
MPAASSKPKPSSIKKKPAARRPVPPARARRTQVATRPSLRALLSLEPHHLDLLGLALIALGTFLGGIIYLHWGGGAVGHGFVTGLRLLMGVFAVIIPAALLLAGALVIGRELRSGPPTRPLRAGAICLAAALTLAMAAGTLGLGPGREPTHGFWAGQVLQARGGILGAGEFWVLGHLISTAGADIIAIFLFLAAAILLSGATLASLLLATRDHSRRLAEITITRMPERTRVPEPNLTFTDRRRTRRDTNAALDAEADRFDDLDLPDPPTQQLIVRATHVEAPPVVDAPVIPSFETPEFASEVDEFDPNGALDDAAEDDLADETGGEGPWAASADAPPETSDPAGEAAASRPVDPADLTPRGRYRAAVTDDPAFPWRAPSARLLTRSTGEAARPDTAGQEQVAAALLEALSHFGIDAKVIGRVAGPHITRYEIRLAPGVKMSKVANLKDDLAYALAATDIRILAPIPGKTAVGIEVPNARRRIVHLGDVYQDAPEGWSPLTVWLGKDISGKAIGADLAKMPHLLVAGTTGAGKSACVNAMLSSVLLRATPHEVRLVLVDPKQVELNLYESIPHLLTPVITSPRMAANALQNLVREMEQRYGIMSLARTRNLPELNKVRESRGETALPYILCVIDELADLMMVAPADVEDSIIRLAQKARAVGIHLVLATQSPRVDVITGMIKANVPSRIAFAVSSQTDSRVILDQGGAESLLGQGDMLFSPVGTSRLQRIQGAYIDEPQIEEICGYWRAQGEPELREELLAEVEAADEAINGGEDDGFDPDEDPLLEEAIALVAQMQTASTSMLQRRLRLGYTRAGRLIDMLERRGIISGYEGSKPRQVLITEADVPRIIVALAEAGRGGGGGADPAPPVPGPLDPDIDEDAPAPDPE